MNRTLKRHGIENVIVERSRTMSPAFLFSFKVSSEKDSVMYKRIRSPEARKERKTTMETDMQFIEATPALVCSWVSRADCYAGSKKVQEKKKGIRVFFQEMLESLTRSTIPTPKPTHSQHTFRKYVHCPPVLAPTLRGCPYANDSNRSK